MTQNCMETQFSKLFDTLSHYFNFSKVVFSQHYRKTIVQNIQRMFSQQKPKFKYFFFVFFHLLMRHYINLFQLNPIETGLIHKVKNGLYKRKVPGFQNGRSNPENSREGTNGCAPQRFYCTRKGWKQEL
jgi:hypothetical protein